MNEGTVTNEPGSGSSGFIMKIINTGTLDSQASTLDLGANNDGTGRTPRTWSPAPTAAIRSSAIGPFQATSRP